MSGPDYTFVRGDDWQAIYIDGEIWRQDHSIRHEDWIQLLEEQSGRKVKIVWADLDWLAEQGSFPSNLGNIVEES